MIINNIYCQASGMTMQCINDLKFDLGDRLPIVVELGCADGQGTARYGGFCEHVICVDPMISGRPDIESYEEDWLTENAGKVKRFEDNTSHIRDNVTLIKACSAWPSTVESVVKALDGREIDILLIDGVHHPFEAVWKDFELYYPFVRSGGFVVLDDLYEKCILEVWNKAQKDLGFIPHDRKALKGKFRKWPDILQDTGALRKP
ncbi:MAG: class I SAM-dependent methyltransferase [Candidatus Thorarchaeota archaeon]|jgi:cephalosporin hydroxylase